jgi:D-sedoheptulose 7-phosphate isomerase
MDVSSIITKELTEAQSVLNRFISEPSNIEAIAKAADMIVESLKKGGKVISCGNGGSHCDAMHFAEELSGRYRDDRRALAAVSISDVSHITCVGNDYGFEFIFSRYIEGLGNAGDVLFALSTSGNSKNVLRAAEEAKRKGMKVIAMTGKDGGRLGPLADVEIRVGHGGYADRIQEVHIKVIHILILLIERRIGGDVTDF